MTNQKFVSACEAAARLFPLASEWTLYYGEPCDREGLAEFAAFLDLENPMNAPGCYYVAGAEGDLGITVDDGHNIQWIAKVETPVAPEELMMIAETPEAVVVGEFRKKIRGIRDSFTWKGMKKIFISGLILLLVWLGTMIWQRYAHDKTSLILSTIVAFLTFANGGASSNYFYMLGGMLGKTFVMTTMFAFVLGGFKKVGRGFNRFIQRTKHLNSMRGISLYVAGMGAACVLYNFFTGKASYLLCMVGVAGVLSMLWTLGGGVHFIRRMTVALTAHINKQTKIHYVHLERTSYVLAGMALGFLVAILLSVLPWGFTPYIVGAGCFAVSAMCIPFIKKDDDLPTPAKRTAITG